MNVNIAYQSILAILNNPSNHDVLEDLVDLIKKTFEGFRISNSCYYKIIEIPGSPLSPVSPY
jgi:hypothetical protein